MKEEDDEEDYLKRSSEKRKVEDTVIQSTFLTNPTEERKNEGTKMQIVF